jgi:5-formyltetrahydrofolate cyclo-ligase
MTGTKSELRRQLINARRNVVEAVRFTDANALATHMVEAVTGTDVVCAYVPVGTEPGTVAMLDSLATNAARVLLPLARHDDHGTPLPLSWADYHPGELIAAEYGLREPAGPALSPYTIAEATVVFVPALAADRRGVRLGRGAGFYDRSLPFARPDARLIAVVRDDELFDELPAEPHDVRMAHVLTPGGGLIAVG